MNSMHMSGTSARRDARDQAAIARNGDLLDAMVAAYALMAHADGEVAAAERRRIFAILRDNVSLSVFSREEIVDQVAEHEANFRLDPELAQQIAREKLAAVVGQGVAARSIVHACRALIPADGIAHPAEYRALREIKDLLGIEDRPPVRRFAKGAEAAR